MADADNPQLDESQPQKKARVDETGDAPEKGVENGAEKPAAGGADDEFLTARLALLRKEKELTRLHDEVAALRRQLPQQLVEKEYALTGTDGHTVTLRDLFTDKEKPLVLYHFMWPKEWDRACKSCSFWADGYNGLYPHIRVKANLCCVSRASADKLRALCERKEWQVPFYSSEGSEFNADFGVGFSAETIASKDKVYNYGTKQASLSELPGCSIFRLEAESGKVYHTYSCYTRGLESLNSTWALLDLLPGGRAEEGKPMGWLQHKEDY